MRIAVTGATGNVGSALLRALDREDAVEEVLAIARRRPDPADPETGLPAKARAVTADVVHDDLERHFRGCDAVVHLAWAIQPMRDRAKLRAVNVGGSARVFQAAARAGVSALVHASSVGAYSPVAPGTWVREDHATQGVPSASYSVDKVACERLLDRVEADHPDLRVVRLRPAIITQRDAAFQQMRYFLGVRPPGLSRLLGRGLPPGVLPVPPSLRIQVVHADDVADAYRRAVLAEDARGAYNVAAEPVLDPKVLGRVLKAVPVPVPAVVTRSAMAAAYALHAIPTEPGWFDMGMGSPLLDTSRIERDLGWRAARRADEALDEVLHGARTDARGPTPPLRVPSEA